MDMIPLGKPRCFSMTTGKEVSNTTGISKEELINWFVGLSFIDKLSLYEGKEKLGVYNQ